MHTDRLETHGKAGDVEPPGFFNDTVAEGQADSATTGHRHGLTIGSSDEGVLDSGVVGKVKTAGRHGVGGARVNTQTGFRREAGSGSIGGAEEPNREREEIRIHHVGGEVGAGGATGGINFRTNLVITTFMVGSPTLSREPSREPPHTSAEWPDP